MIVYYVIPLIIFLISIIFYVRKNDNYTALFLHFFILVTLILFAGFRGEKVSRDYENYTESISIIQQGGEVVEFTEPGFSYITNLAYAFSDSALLVFVIYAFLGVTLKYFSILRISGISFGFLAIVSYFSNFYLFHEMTQIRIGVASGLFLFSIPYILERQFFKFLFIILLASVFHASILVTLPLYFLNYKTINPKFWIGLMVINLLFYLFGLSLFDLSNLFLNDFFDMKLDAYLSFMQESTGDTNITIFNRFLIYLIINITLLNFYELLKGYSKYFIFLLKTSFISLSIAFFFYDFYLFSFRFSEIFGVVQICLFPFLALIFKERLFGYILVFAVVLILLFVNVSLTKVMNPYYFSSF